MIAVVALCLVGLLVLALIVGIIDAYFAASARNDRVGLRRLQGEDRNRIELRFELLPRGSIAYIGIAFGLAGAVSGIAGLWLPNSGPVPELYCGPLLAGTATLSVALGALRKRRRKLAAARVVLAVVQEDNARHNISPDIEPMRQIRNLLIESGDSQLADRYTDFIATVERGNAAPEPRKVLFTVAAPEDAGPALSPERVTRFGDETAG